MEKQWQERFHLSEADYNEWQSSAQEDSFAVYALKTNKIHNDQYMEWALHCYQLPFLMDSFFHNITIHQQLWDRVKDQAQWSETFLPLYEWDNVLFVGCLQVPKKELARNMVPLLVSPKNLRIFWHKIKTFSSSAQIAVPKVEREKELALDSIEEDPETAVFAKSTGLLNTFIKTTIGSSRQQVQIKGNKVYDQVFKLSEKYFTGSIIFSFQDKVFQPVEWSDSMEGPAVPIQTDKPSIFRMIVRSRSPYHGFIIDNEEHRQFFGPWGFKELPKHITLIPVFNSAKSIIGAFMGIADKNLPEKYLYAITKWTGHLSKALSETAKQNKKSA